VFWNHTKNVFVVTAFNVPQAPKGKVYQLWAMRNGKEPLSMGTFNPDPSGRALAVIPVGSIADAGRIDDCAMTLEPEGGSPQPTEAPRLRGAWRHVD
ncbi:MAG: anti-sigma factor, partial [Gemmatimonadaceae bacterium]